jgi:hypothetical protein
LLRSDGTGSPFLHDLSAGSKSELTIVSFIPVPQLHPE